MFLNFGFYSLRWVDLFRDRLDCLESLQEESEVFWVLMPELIIDREERFDHCPLPPFTHLLLSCDWVDSTIELAELERDALRGVVPKTDWGLEKNQSSELGIFVSEVKPSSDQSYLSMVSANGDICYSNINVIASANLECHVCIGPLII